MSGPEHRRYYVEALTGKRIDIPDNMPTRIAAVLANPNAELSRREAEQSESKN